MTDRQDACPTNKRAVCSFYYYRTTMTPTVDYQPNIPRQQLTSSKPGFLDLETLGTGRGGYGIELGKLATPGQ